MSDAKQKVKNEKLRGHIIRLEAEIARLRAENEKLSGMVAKDTGTWQDLWTGERAINERLKEEIANLRAPNWNAMLDIARAALEGKP